MIVFEAQVMFSQGKKINDSEIGKANHRRNLYIKPKKGKTNLQYRVTDTENTEMYMY